MQKRLFSSTDNLIRSGNHYICYHENYQYLILPAFLFLFFFLKTNKAQSQNARLFGGYSHVPLAEYYNDRPVGGFHVGGMLEQKKWLDLIVQYQYHDLYGRSLRSSRSQGNTLLEVNRLRWRKTMSAQVGVLLKKDFGKISIGISPIHRDGARMA